MKTCEALLLLILANLVGFAAFGQGEIEQRNSYKLGAIEFYLLDELQKTSNSVDGNTDFEPCKTWTLHRDSLKRVVPEFRQAEPGEWGALCYNLPCAYNTKIETLQGEIGEVYINAASYIILTIKGEQTIYILEKESPLFLMACDCCE